MRTDSDSRAAGEQLLALVTRLRGEPPAELHCSLAGGRKTLGALLALTLQVVGRGGDRLYHVLVNPPFEQLPGFFFPPRLPRRLRWGRATISTSRAHIELAEIPLVRLGDLAQGIGLTQGSLGARAGGLESAALASSGVPIRLDRATRAVRADGAMVQLTPQQFALYWLYAEARAGCRTCTRMGEGCARCHLTDREIGADPRLLDLYRSTPGSGPAGRMGGGTSAEARFAFDEWIREARSRLAARLRELPPAVAAACRLRLLPGPGRSDRRGVMAPPSTLRFSTDNVVRTSPGPGYAGR
jgi:hypothetical protein